MTGYQDAINDALERLDDLGYERQMGGGDLANHGPMAAETLAILGHGDQIPAWIEIYRQAAPHHEPPSPHTAIDPRDDSWKEALGDISRAGDFEQLITRQLTEQPWQEVLAMWWPRLLPGPMTGLTHGLIRTAHAVRGLSATTTPTGIQLRELAKGLGFWAGRYTGDGRLRQLRGTHPIAQAIAAMDRSPVDTSSFAATKALMQNPHQITGYTQALDLPAPDQTQKLISDMTAEFAGLCIIHSTEAFPVALLHGVTAPAAARLVIPHLPTSLHASTLAALWQAQVTLLRLATTTHPDEKNATTVAAHTTAPGWNALIDTAVDHHDEHVIKFTEACAREHLLRPDPRYTAAVHIAQQKISRPTT